MDPVRAISAARVAEALDAALAVDEAERIDALPAICGHDAALEREVISLLEALGGGGGFMERSPTGAAARLPGGDLTGLNIGPYSVGQQIGSGGMGVVYKGRDTRLDRTIALKTLSPDVVVGGSGGVGLRESLEREAKALAQLNHPNIGAIYGVEFCERAPGGLVLILEFVRGQTLAARLRSGPLSIERAIAVAMAIASGLEAAHAAGIIHRDLKPANIMLCGDAADGLTGVKVLDFGLARALARGQPSLSTSLAALALVRQAGGMSHAGGLMGTAAYISPELAMRDAADHPGLVDHVDQLDHADHVDHVDHVDHAGDVDHVGHVGHVRAPEAGSASPVAATPRAPGEPLARTRTNISVTPDRRADIWALGCVIYEMLTAKQVFGRESVMATLQAVVTEEPDYTLLPKQTPLGLLTLLRRCLRKDVSLRQRDAGDVRLLLVEALDELQRKPTAPARRASWPLWGRVAAGVGFIGAASLGLLAGWPQLNKSRHTALVSGAAELPLQSGLTRYAAAAFEIPLTADAVVPDEMNPIAISPSGDLLVVAVGEYAASRLVKRKLDDHHVEVIEGTQGASSPFFSPDGAWIGYVDSGRGELRKIRPDGSGLATMAKINKEARWLCWLPDGRVIFCIRWMGGLWQLPTGAAATIPLTFEVGAGGAERLDRVRITDLLPDGLTVLATVESNLRTVKRIETIHTRTGKRAVIVENASEGALIGASTLGMLRGGTMLMVGFDPATGAIAGSERAVAGASDIARSGKLDAASVRMSRAAGGMVAYLPASPDPFGSLRWVDQGGAEEIIVSGDSPLSDPVVAPDGVRIAACKLTDISDIWVFDTSRRPISSLQLTRGISTDRLVWSPDGKTIGFCGVSPLPSIIPTPATSLTPGQIGLFTVDAGGLSDPVLLVKFDQQARLYAWHPTSGEMAVAVERFVGIGFDIEMVLVKPPHTRRQLLATDASEFGITFSRDGMWMAFTRDQGSSSDVYVAPYPAGTPLQRVSPLGGYRARWGWDDKHLYFQRDRDVFRASVGREGGGLVLGEPVLLHSHKFHDQYDVGPRDRAAASITLEPEGRSLRVIIGLNGGLNGGG